MKFQQIIYFLRTCDTLSFTRAAEICHVSQPSLSAAIQRLEDELGGKLFDRSGQVIRLTTLGESMRVHLSRIEEARNSANIAASNIVGGVHSTIHFGFMCSLNPSHLLSAAAQFSRKFEDTELVIHDVWEEKALEMLLTGAVDCVLMASTSPLTDQFESEFLADDPIVLAMGKTHRLANHERVTTADLQGERYVDRLRCEFRAQLFRDLDLKDVNVKVTLRSEREDLVVDAVSSAVGVTIMPKSAAENKQLVVAPIVDLPVCRKLKIVTVRGRELSPVVSSLIEQVSENYRTP